MSVHNNYFLRSWPALLLLNLWFANVAWSAELAPPDPQAQASTEAASPDYTYRIKVLRADSHALGTGTPVPKDCDLENFSAYCNESKHPTRQNTMLVQGSDGKTFYITCDVDSHFSGCTLLPEGQTFDAKRAKQGITVLYRDTKGKDKKQFYQVMAVPPPLKPAATASPQQPAAPPTVTSPTGAPSGAMPAAEPEPAPAAAPGATSKRVLCNFTSTPDGAEITVDGNFVGNTPSGIALSTGTHFVVLSLTGYTPWKRKLTVESGSDVNVTATLQKAQP
jgi:hypothetical protein